VLGVFNSILLIIFKIFIRNSGHVPSPRTFSGSTVCPSRNAGGTSSGRGGCFHVRSTMSHLHKRRARPDTNGVFSHLPIVGRWVIYTIDISVTRSTIYPIAPASFVRTSPLPPMSLTPLLRKIHRTLANGMYTVELVVALQDAGYCDRGVWGARVLIVCHRITGKRF
jgi:hypothetical protein